MARVEGADVTQAEDHSQGADEDTRAGRSPADARNGTNPRRELVREQLIDIAARLFDSKGYAQTSINDIARAIGLGRSAVYHYFRNKEEIVAALVESEALTPSGRLQELIEQADLTPTERLRRAIVDGIKRRLGAGSRFILLGRLEAQIPEELEPLYNKGRRDIYNFHVRCIKDGIRTGEFREVDPKVAAFAVIGMANWTSRWYSPSGQRSPDEIGEIIADFALHGLSARDRVVQDDHGIAAALDGMRAQLDWLEKRLK